jgi:hypothetical protein
MSNSQSGPRIFAKLLAAMLKEVNSLFDTIGCASRRKRNAKNRTAALKRRLSATEFQDLLRRASSTEESEDAGDDKAI